MDCPPWRNIDPSTQNQTASYAILIQNPDSIALPLRSNQCSSLPPVPTGRQLILHSIESSETPMTTESRNAPQRPPLQSELTSSAQIDPGVPTSYGLGDEDGGFDLNPDDMEFFDNMESFEQWRAKLWDDDCIEFIFKNRSASKAKVPKFKERVTLVCSRKRVGGQRHKKKNPERTQKTPSRKIEGQGCPASIIYYTYHESSVIRAKYVNKHSHPIGPDNLPYTRKGRKDSKNSQKDKIKDGYRRANPILNGTAQLTEELKSGKSAEPKMDFQIKSSSMGSPDPAHHQPQEPRSLGQVKEEEEENTLLQGSSQAPILDVHTSSFPAESNFDYEAPAARYPTISYITTPVESYYTGAQLISMPQEHIQQINQPNSIVYQQKPLLLTPTTPTTHIQYHQQPISIPPNHFQAVSEVNNNLLENQLARYTSSSEEEIHGPDTNIPSDLSYQYQYEQTLNNSYPTPLTPVRPTDANCWQRIEVLFQHIKVLARTQPALLVSLEHMLWQIIETFTDPSMPNNTTG